VTTLLDYVSSPETLRPVKVILVDGEPFGFRDADYRDGALQGAGQIVYAAV